MLLLLQERLIGDSDLYCMSSDVDTMGTPKSNTAVWEVITAVQSACHNKNKHLHGGDTRPTADSGNS